MAVFTGYRFLFCSWVLLLVWPRTVNMICFYPLLLSWQCYFHVLKNHLFSCKFSPSFTLLNFSLVFVMILPTSHSSKSTRFFGLYAVMLDALRTVSKMLQLVQVWLSLFSTTGMNVALEINRKFVESDVKQDEVSYLLYYQVSFSCWAGLCWVRFFPCQSMIFLKCVVCLLLAYIIWQSKHRVG